MAAVFDAAAGMLRELPGVLASAGVGREPCLLDMAQAADAMARALGWPAGLCFDTLRSVEDEGQAAIVADDPVAARLVALVDASPNGIWTGTPTEGARALRNVGECLIFCVWLIGSMFPERSKDDDDFQRIAARIAEGLQAA